MEKMWIINKHGVLIQRPRHKCERLIKLGLWREFDGDNSKVKQRYCEENKTLKIKNIITK